MAKVKALTGVEVNLKQFHSEQKNDEKQRKSKTKHQPPSKLDIPQTGYKLGILSKYVSTIHNVAT